MEGSSTIGDRGQPAVSLTPDVDAMNICYLDNQKKQKKLTYKLFSFGKVKMLPNPLSVLEFYLLHLGSYC